MWWTSRIQLDSFALHDVLKIDDIIAKVTDGDSLHLLRFRDLRFEIEGLRISSAPSQNIVGKF